MPRWCSSGFIFNPFLFIADIHWRGWEKGETREAEQMRGKWEEKWLDDKPALSSENKEIKDGCEQSFKTRCLFHSLDTFSYKSAETLTGLKQGRVYKVWGQWSLHPFYEESYRQRWMMLRYVFFFQEEMYLLSVKVAELQKEMLHGDVIPLLKINFSST